MRHTITPTAVAPLVLAAVALVLTARPAASTIVGEDFTAAGPAVNIALYAKADFVTSADGGSVPFWGLTTSLSGRPQYPSPTLILAQGQTVNVTVHNQLGLPAGAGYSQSTSLVFPGHDVTSCAGAPGVLTCEDTAGGSATYTFTADPPALFVILQAPLFAWLCLRMGARQPSSPAKFVLGLFCVGLGFVGMSVAAGLASGGAKVGVGWLLATYFLHVVGEMCLSPVGLSTVTKLAPARVTGLMMGVWFLASAVGNYLGGRAAGLYETVSLPLLFGAIAAVTVAAGIVLFLFLRPIRGLMGGVR